MGYLLLDGFYDSLGIYDVLNKFKSQSKISYDLNGISKLFIFNRILCPDSKLGAFEERDHYLFPVSSSNQLSDVYRSLDCLDSVADAIQARINHKISSIIGRNAEVCYYDVTNYYFEISENDEDKITEDDKTTLGLRKKGPSKEKRGEPIVQMGLFIDDNGIPIAYRLFPGNNIDQTTLRPAMKKTLDKMNFKRVIIIADGGLNSGQNIAHILYKGNGYIISKSTKKTDKSTQKWILDENGYQYNEHETFKVKSMIRTRNIKDENNKVITIKEKLISYWSKKHCEREKHANYNFIKYLKSVIDNPDKLKDKPRKIEKFLKKSFYDKNTGEVLNSKTSIEINYEKVQEYFNLMGYYTVMTSEIDKPDMEIIKKYHGLSRIEDSFRIMKSDLEGRPVFVRTAQHINAHFLTCFIALTIIRLIQYKILESQGKNTLNKDGWESGLTAERIQEALNLWFVEKLSGEYYRLKKPTEDLKTILKAFKVDGELKIPSGKDLHQLKKKFDEAAFM
jgi:transposase